MKRKIRYIIVLFLLTACSKPIEEEANKNISTFESGVITENNDSNNIDSEKEKSSMLNELIKKEYEHQEPELVDASEFNNMDYLLFVQEGKEYYTTSDYWTEYALLGSDYDIYEKGKQYYDCINALYEKRLISAEYEKIKAEFGQGVVDQYFRRNISCFSADGTRVLLKLYTEFYRASDVLYQIYEGDQFHMSYLRDDIVVSVQTNYTLNMEYVRLGNEENNFVKVVVDNLMERDRGYSITTTTDPEDTVYARSEQDEDGSCHIRLYSIEDNTCIYESEPVEFYPTTISIIENRIIVGYSDKQGFDINYFEINTQTNECNYLFSNPEGIFSPDGKYFAYTSERLDSEGPAIVEKGYYIYNIETGKTVFYLTRIMNIEEEHWLEGFDLNRIVCWVSKEGLESLLNNHSE